MRLSKSAPLKKVIEMTLVKFWWYFVYIRFSVKDSDVLIEVLLGNVRLKYPIKMNFRISSLIVRVVSRISLSFLPRVVWCQSGVSRALIGGLLWGCAWLENGISCEALPASRAVCQSPDVHVGEGKCFWSLNKGDCFLFHLPKWRRIDFYDSLFPPVPYREKERERWVRCWELCQE